MTRRWQRVAGLTIGIALMVISYLAAGVNGELDDNDLQIFFGITFHIVMMLLACVISATAIAQEKESDTWTILLASPVSGAAIVWGKAIGCARRLLWPMVAMAGHFLLFTVAGVITPVATMTALVVIAGFNAIWIATGVWLSLRCRKVTFAVIMNLSLPVLLYGVFSLVLVLIDELLRIQGDDLMEQITWWLPFYYIGEIMNAGGWDHHRGPSRPGGNWQEVSQGEFFLIASGMAALHLAVAAALLSWTAARFNAIVGRAPQEMPLPHGFPVTPTAGPSWSR